LSLHVVGFSQIGHFTIDTSRKLARQLYNEPRATIEEGIGGSKPSLPIAGRRNSRW
jgi:hypothetical protein